MQLFDAIARNDLSPGEYSEPAFAFLNRSARPESSRVRQVLEDWFSHYPVPEQREMRSRFRSEIDAHHQAAFFELFLHELLLRLGCQITIHPPVTDTSSAPDFLAQPQKGDPFYIEGTVATNESLAQATAHARENVVYDVLDREVDGASFFLALTIRGAPATPPPAKRLASFLNQHLAALDPDEVARLYEAGGMRSVPEWHFQHDGWSIVFHPIPKKPEARNKTGVRPLGAFSTELHWAENRTAIRDAITRKASRYGKLEKAYIVAVDVLEPVDEIDIMEALFGKEQFTISFSETDSDNHPEPRMSRVPDGAWTSIGGPRYKRVSGVLIAPSLRPWNIPRTGLRLYHNPWAERPYRSVLTRLPQAVPQENRLEAVQGLSSASLFDLSDTWPEAASQPLAQDRDLL